jgi:radical SAM superfamily enzyme YgiQ (UPF0313 family)
MNVALVGPELEENLALRYVHAAVTNAGHVARIYDFHAIDQLEAVAEQIIGFAPEVVGMSMMFTARSKEFVDLTTRLRELGYTGHVTAGGHFASFHAEVLLTDYSAFDSIVHGEGEEGMCDLLANLDSLASVTGITYRDANGSICHTGFRSNIPALDDRAYPTRPQRFHEYMGLGIASLLAGRGCYASCNFCSINAWHRQSGGPKFRQRHVGAIAHEMAELYHCHGVRIFNFQDDQFFLPTEKKNLERLGALERELDRHDVGKIALQVKARPDSITKPVVAQLKKMGLFRVFLGVETNAVVGLVTLGRGVRREQNHLALDILRELEIHTCFNLLIFDPESQFEALWDNIRFLERQVYFPLNFCRVEVYAGTEIECRLRAEDRLIGDYHGYTYKIANPDVQRAYEMFREVFTPRNFRVDGMNHQAMRLDYYYHLLTHFHASRGTARLTRPVKAIIAELNHDNATLLGRICRFAESSNDATPNAVRSMTKSLCAERIDFDRHMRPRIETLLAHMKRLARKAQRPKPQPISKVANVAAAALLAGTLGCGPKPDTHMAEMAPPDPTLYETANLTAQQIERVQHIIAQQYGPALLDFARQHGLTATQQQVELEITSDGRVVGASMLTQPQLDEYLLGLVGDWYFPDVVFESRSAFGVITLSFPEDVDTHMAEMAPPDPTPPPVPDGHLGEFQVSLLEQQINDVHRNDLIELGKKHAGDIEWIDVTVELGAGGTIEKVDVLLPDGVTKSKLTTELPKLMKGWAFPDFADGGIATITVVLTKYLAPKPPDDTHMAEMAPYDPSW